MAEEFQLRRAWAADAGVIAQHRVRMFEDMGMVPASCFEELRRASEELLAEMIARGEYLGWLASPASDPTAVVAGAGVQLRQVLPHPARLADGGYGVGCGRHAIVLNVYTEPGWRRQGIAALLMRQIIEWARQERLDRLVLHASDQGRPLYTRLGFVATNEMRFNGSLT